MRFNVTTLCRATIRETWTVEAADEDEAREKMESSDAVFVSQEIAEVTGDIEEETDREVETVEVDPLS